MSDTPDPFAARPYVPPHARDDQDLPDADPSEAATVPVPEPAAEVGEQPIATSEPAAADAATVDVVADTEPTDEPGVEPAVEVTEPEADTQPEPEATAPETAAPESAGPESASPESASPESAGPFTHRFDEAVQTSRPAEPLPQETTAVLPPMPDGPMPVSSAPPAAAQQSSWYDDHDAAPHPHVASATPRETRDPRGRSKLASALGMLLIGGAAGVGGAAAYEEFLAPGQSSIASSIEAPSNGEPAPQTAVEAVAARVRPSVVQINFRAGDEGGSGTGIIISEDGQILTNNHVVETAAENDGSLVAVFSDGSHAEAKVLGRDPQTDLAVIKAKGKSGLQPATLGSSKDLRVGQGVVVVGSPFGLESTVTSGIVSALNRPVATTRGGDELIIPSFQSDAAINMGNSGGPVSDMEGRVVGVVTAIRAGSEGGSIGLGFAIPIDLAKGVAGHLVKGQKVEHAQIGVTVSPAVADDEITKIGAEIQSVLPNSAGQKAGLKKGDIVTAVENNPIASNEALVAAIRGFQPGQTVTITFLRGDETKKATVTLDSDGGKKSAATEE